MTQELPNLRHLRAFSAVARLRSVNAGAEAVNLSQPAVTQAIAKLEAHFGDSLLARRSSGSYPTQAGAILARRVERFLAQLRLALREIAGPAIRKDPAALSRLEQRITVPQIRALIAIADGGSFSLGAKLIQVAEPSLHRAAREGERLVGRPLFIRSVMGLGPTRGTLELVRRLKVAIREIDQAREEITALQGVDNSRLAVACLPLGQALILPRTVNALLEIHPEVRVQISDGSYDNLLQDLRNGRVDFLIGALRNPPPVRDVVEAALFDDPYAVVARRGHPIFSLGAITLKTLARYDWAIPRVGTPVRRAFDRLFHGRKMQPRVQIEASSLVVTRAVLAESNRLTLLSRRQIVVEEKLGLLRVVPFALPETTRPIGVTTRTDWLPSAVHVAFLNLLRRQAEAPDRIKKIARDS